MQLISLEAISRNYTPIILWLQEVDEEVRTDSEEKAGGLLLMMRKFNPYFYNKVFWMAFGIAESVSAEFQRAQPNLCEFIILMLAQKLLSLAQKIMPDSTAYGRKL